MIHTRPSSSSKHNRDSSPWIAIFRFTFGLKSLLVLSLVIAIVLSFCFVFSVVVALALTCAV